MILLLMSDQQIKFPRVLGDEVQQLQQDPASRSSAQSRARCWPRGRVAAVRWSAQLALVMDTLRPPAPPPPLTLLTPNTRQDRKRRAV